MDDGMNKVAVLIEQLMSQFNTFGEGLDGLREEMNRRFDKVDTKFAKTDNRFNRVESKIDRLEQMNESDHQQLKQMIRELAADQKEIQQKVTDLDKEFEIKLRRIK